MELIKTDNETEFICIFNLENSRDSYCKVELEFLKYLITT